VTLYIALLRGINVGGRRTVKMEKLKSIMESLEFQNVKTYIQSGNVLFETEARDTNLLRQSIESKLDEELGFKIPAIVRTGAELEDVVKQNPFHSGTESENTNLHLTFLSSEPDEKALDRLASYKNDVDDFRVLNREVYLRCGTGYGTTMFSNNFFESMLKVLATTRNWKTVNKILRLSEV